MSSAATSAVEAGRPQDLIETPSPLVFGRTSAATVLSRAAADDIALRIREVKCPTLALYGEAEQEIGGQADLDRLAGLAASPFRGLVIPGADHLYTGHEAEVARAVERWLAGAIAPAEQESRS
jgi:pimeloyl-ACP methyl ester carboxylesterase